MERRGDPRPDRGLAGALHDALLRGEYAPGQRLVEADLCDRFGASRAAVRESLRLLAGDGLVVLEPHRGARVRRITLDEAIEIAEVRVAVEVLLARRAAEHITPQTATELRDIATGIRGAIEGFDPVAHSALNERLHLRIAEIADHETAAAVVRKLRTQLVSFQVRLSTLSGRAQTTLAEHEQITAAIADGDPDAAVAAMRRHLEGAVAALRALRASDGSDAAGRAAHVAGAG
ncbi:GntR family transcriptional regulator [Actinotalea sp. M2MS4P-6]|uniref:GntR family transcriptional regulator n=1 Tax=Actinotalea sp. M2MS4P-6 TaxID=2983762 RepID=UPI0021E37FC9|nr:GntR family transcriptional regulator [Actinotalea sp. M2MS4P-6]MCV2394400.1 GntR family transcriptional regulator [Actinotalea sp. M2MS4P-6]